MASDGKNGPGDRNDTPSLLTMWPGIYVLGTEPIVNRLTPPVLKSADGTPTSEPSSGSGSGA